MKFKRLIENCFHCGKKLLITLTEVMEFNEF